MRRTVVVLLVLVGVAAGGFGLGYVVGHREARLQPVALPTLLPRNVQVPRLLKLPIREAVDSLLSSNLKVGKVEVRTGGPPGTIVAQFPIPGTSVPLGSEVNLFVSTSVYPRGAFEWCPAVAATLPVEPDMGPQAEQIALRFAKAFLSGGWHTVRGLLDPAALPLRKHLWTVAGKPGRVSVGGFGLHDPLVAYGCGKDVDQRDAVVVLDDGTRSASADFKLYMVRRADGWRVWASY